MWLLGSQSLHGNGWAMSTSCRSCPWAALTQGQHQAVTPLGDMTEKLRLGQGLPQQHPPLLGLLPV